MKKLLLLILILNISRINGFSYVDYSDGQYHVIDYAVNDNVYLNMQSHTTGTTLELREGGYIHYSLSSEYDGSVIIAGGTVRNNVSLHDDSTLTMIGGEIGRSVNAYWSEHVDISNANIGNNIQICTNSYANISACNVGKSIHSTLSAEVFIDDCIIGSSITVSGTSQMSIRTSSVNGSILLLDDAHLRIDSGVFALPLAAIENSNVMLLGGVFQYAIRAGSDVHGSHDTSIITLIGDRFSVNGKEVAYGQYFASDFSSGHLNGILSNGDVLDTDFEIWDDASIILMPVPEPVTMSLLAAGSLALLRRKRW